MSGKSNEGTKREFFPQLTSVRFFAALIVVCYHYEKELTPFLPMGIKNLVLHGYIGVSFFFLLSGFILGANYYDRLLTRRVSKGDFWWARFSRIYPLYILSIIVFLPRFMLPLRLDPLPEQAVFAHAHPFFVITVVVFVLQTFFTVAGAFLNSPTWSISTEVFFYILLPFLIPLFARIKTKYLFPTMVVLFLSAGVLPYLYHENILQSRLWQMGVDYNHDVDFGINQFIRINFLARLPEFAIGVLAYRLYREWLADRHHKWIYMIGIPASLPFLYMVFTEPEDRIIKTVLYTGQFLSIPFFLMLLLALIGPQPKALKFLQGSTWVLLGEASYALYLFHLPIKHFGQYVVGKALHLDKMNLAMNVSLIGFAVALSIPLFLYVETPTRKKLTAWWKNRHTPPDSRNAPAT